MDNKFLRNYILVVQDNSPNAQFISIQLPFTIEFDIRRDTYASVNVASIRIYNLSERTRNLLMKDYFNYDVSRSIVLQAGYGAGPNFPVVFSGNVNSCWSVREGNNYITYIEAFDGGFAVSNSVFSAQFKAGTPQDTVIKAMIDSLKPFGVSPGAIGTYPGNISRGNAYAGATTDLLREITGGGFFIDNMKANCLKNDECIQSDGISVITSSSGLLGTPKREETVLMFDIIFEPRISAGQIIELESVSGNNYNGFYQVNSIQHRATISTAVCGDAVTSLGVWYDKELRTVQSTTTR